MCSTYVDRLANYGFQCASSAGDGRSSRTSRSNHGLCSVFLRGGERRRELHAVFGFDRIFLVLEELNLFPKTVKNRSHFLFLNFDDKSAEFSFKMVTKIREQEIPCELYPKDVKLKKQMNYADQRNIPFVIMIGPEEIKNDIFIIKDMKTGDQSKHSISSIITILGFDLIRLLYDWFK